MNNVDFIVDKLSVYRDYYSQINDPRYYAYLKAIDSIKRELTGNENARTIIDLMEQRQIPHVGESITEKVRKMFNNEELPHYTEFSAQINRVPENPHKHYMTRDNVEWLTLELNNEFNKKGIDFKICGSYRRNEPLVGDLDYLIIADDLEFVTERLNVLKDNNFYNIQFLAVGDQKVKIELRKLNKVIEIDFRACPEGQLGSMLLYFTGPKNFNIMMRSQAKKKGYSLNEYGLTELETDNLIQSQDEHKFFDLLDMKYVSPEERKYYK